MVASGPYFITRDKHAVEGAEHAVTVESAHLRGGATSEPATRRQGVTLEDRGLEDRFGYTRRQREPQEDRGCH